MEMIKTAGRGFLAILAVFAFMGLAACEEDGPAEKAGEKIDDAARKTGEAADDAAKDIKRALEK